MKDDLLNEILQQLNRSTSPDKKWPDKKGDYWSLCPFHNDSKPNNFSVGENGFKCFSCHEGGSLQKLAKHLGIEVRNYNNQGITLDDYAEAKKLPLGILEGLGISDGKRKGKPIIKIPYLDTDKIQRGVRLRHSWTGDFRFSWQTNSKVIPYGLWRMGVLSSCAANGGDKREILLVEGESDAHTLWSYKQNALGIPGATSWNSDWAKYLEGYDVYIWQKPDEGGRKIVESIGKDLPEAKVIVPPPDRKDISECHISGDNVLDLLNMLMKDARKICDIHDEGQARDIQSVFEEAKPLLTRPNILELFSDVCIEMGLVGEEQNAKLIYLALTSRVLDKQVNLIIKGPSSVGKSYTLDTVLKAFPPDAYYALSSMSEHSLAYSEEPVSHRFIIMYEEAGLNSDFANYLLRSLMSEGHIRYETVEKTRDGQKARLIEREGPTGLIETTTKINLHPENETRMLSITMKEDTDQTEKILRSLADQANGTNPRQSDLTSWHALQTWLEVGGNRDVVIPYAHVLVDHTDNSAIRMRRDFSSILNLICANAVLHQLNRDVDESGRIIAVLDDYRDIYPLIIEQVSEGVERAVNKGIREIVEAVEKLAHGERGISQSELAKYLSKDPSGISRKVRETVGRRYLINLEDKKGLPQRLILGDPLPDDTSVLPSPEELENKFSSIPSDGDARDQEPTDSDIAIGEDGKTYDESKSGLEMSIDEHLDLISFSDIGKPCYACGSNNWEPYSDGDRYFCATCHPDEKNEIRE